jgi:hypothetical protein
MNKEGVFNVTRWSNGVIDGNFTFNAIGGTFHGTPPDSLIVVTGTFHAQRRDKAIACERS